MLLSLSTNVRKEALYELDREIEIVDRLLTLLYKGEDSNIQSILLSNTEFQPKILDKTWSNIKMSISRFLNGKDSRNDLKEDMQSTYGRLKDVRSSLK